MLGVLILVLFLIVFVGIFAVVAKQVLAPSVSRATFGRLAEARHGTVHPTHNGQRLVFREKGVPFRVANVRRGGKSFLQITAPIATGSLRLKLFEENIQPELKKFLGMQDIQMGWPEFDAAYIIQSNSVEHLHQILTREVQQAILNLGKQIEVNILRGSWTCQVRPGSFDEQQIARITDQVLVAYFALADSINAPIDPALAQLKFVELDEMVCMVCGETIESNRVDCRSCKTPHHKDCWEYMRVCSTYGCGETKSRRPNPRKPNAVLQIKNRLTP